MSRKSNKSPNSRGKNNNEELIKDKPLGHNCENRGEPHKNNPEWLNHNPELIESAARLNFATRLGLEYKQKQTFIDSKDATKQQDFILANPSFMTYYYEPSVGKSTSMHSAINLAARGIATKIRTVISGNRSYDPSDLMIHILGISNIYDAINIAVRAYGLARYYNTWDVASPNTYLAAMGFNPDSITQNMAYTNGLINKAILKVATLAMPNNIKYINRHAALTSTVFSDGDMVHRAQKFMFQPTFFWKYDPTFMSTGGALVPVWWIEDTSTLTKAAGELDYTKLKTIDEWYAMVSDMIAAYENDSDVWTVDGDIRKAFSDSLIVMSTIPFDYELVPEYSPSMSTQMENMTIVRGHELGDMDSDATARKCKGLYIGDRTIIQNMDYNGLEYNPRYFSRANANNIYANCAISDETILNFHWEDPTPLEIAYATQFTNLYSEETASVDSSTFRAWRAVAPQSEVVIAAVMYSAGFDYTRLWSVNSVASVNWKDLSAITRFDWHNPYYLWDASQVTDTSTGVTGVIGDFDNWTFITQKDIEQIHDATLLSYFDVPMR